MAARVHVSGVPLIVETVWIENISSHGARIRTHRSWQAQDQMVLSGVLGDFRADAEVVYCQHLSGGDYAVGLKFGHPLAAGI